MSRTIEIIKGEEFKIKRTTVRDTDFFFPVYVQARDRLIEIVKSSKSHTTLDDNKGNYSCANYKEIKDSDNQNEDFSNNIIAFCGERGQGKSSAMLTFSDALKKYSKNKDNQETNVLFKDMYKSNAFFYVLDPIDPTQLENKDNILKIVVSRIFSEFKKCWEGTDHNKPNIELKNEMLDLFQKCYKHIVTIKNPSEQKCEDISFEDSLEELARLGDSSNLKKDLIKLIDMFFKIKFTGANSSNYMLVIQIDDTDLNVKKAYEIVEDIRKYLMIPNVVILMATKIEQLTKAVEQQYRDDFKTLIEKDRIGGYELQQMASKYIDKLIPDGRKIYLPEISAVADSSEEQVKLCYYEDKKAKENKDNLLDSKGSNIQDCILKYIYKKNGLIFIKPDQGVHQIIPKTMRELVNFLAVLGKMDDIEDNEVIDKVKRLKNLTTFEEFFLNTWVRNNVDDGYIKRINNIVNTSNINKHRQVITDLYDVIEKSDVYSLNKCSEKHAEGYKKFLDEINEQKESYAKKENALFYSLGDVMDTLKKVELYYPVDTVFKYTFAIKTIYTITMHKIILTLVKQKDKQQSDDKAYTLLDEFMGGDLFGKANSDKMMRSGRSEFNTKEPSGEKLLKSTWKNQTGYIVDYIDDFIYIGFKNADRNYLVYDEQYDFSKISFNLSIYLVKKICCDDIRTTSLKYRRYTSYN